MLDVVVVGSFMGKQSIGHYFVFFLRLVVNEAGNREIRILGFKQIRKVQIAIDYLY